jgi:circadian clock protein KaiA
LFKELIPSFSASLLSRGKLPEKFTSMNEDHRRERQQFFQQMPPAKQQELLQQLKSDYRQIIINYFVADINLKQKIENFINKAFYTDISIPQIIEIHIELIEEFSKQLKLEGRSDEILLNYRLTLIDVLANLCEIYRNAISR